MHHLSSGERSLETRIALLAELANSSRYSLGLCFQIARVGIPEVAPVRDEYFGYLLLYGWLNNPSDKELLDSWIAAYLSKGEDVLGTEWSEASPPIV